MRQLTLVFATLIAACSSDGRERLQDSAAGDVAAAGDVQGSFIIGLTEWKVDSPVDTLPAGRYTFRVENSGKETHGLEVEGNGAEWKTGDLAPGGASEITVDLVPGAYELYCPVESHDKAHDDLGMKRKLVVRPT